MRNVFTAYLANDSNEERISTQLELPATPYEMLDALERLNHKNSDQIICEIEEFYDFGYLAPFLDEDVRLEELNVLAQKLSTFDRCQSIAYEGLVRMEIEKMKPFGVPRMIDLAYSTDCCHIVSDVHTDEELGRFYVGNGFLPEYDELPDKLFDKLNFALIGKEAREGECGVFTQRGYVMQDEDLSEVYNTLDTQFRKPDYMFKLDIRSAVDGQCASLELPASQKQIEQALMDIGLDCWEGVELYGFDGAIQDLDIDLFQMQGVDDLNDLAQKVRQMDECGDLLKFKALLHTLDCHSVRTAVNLADHIDEYILEPATRTPKDVAKSELRFMMEDESAQLLEKHLNLYSYGTDLLARDRASLTPYGLIQRRDCEPIQAIHETDMQSAMKMS